MWPILTCLGCVFVCVCLLKSKICTFNLFQTSDQLLICDYSQKTKIVTWCQYIERWWPHTTRFPCTLRHVKKHILIKFFTKIFSYFWLNFTSHITTEKFYTRSCLYFTLRSLLSQCNKEMNDSFFLRLKI